MSREADTRPQLRPVPEPSPRSWTFEELHSTYFDDVARFVARRIRDREAARDVVQETFLRAYRARATFDRRRPVWPWLSTIARNLILNTIRDEHRRREYVYTALDWDELARTADPRSDVDPERSYTVSQQRAAIAATLVSLRPRQRRVLLLKAAEGLSCESIAAREGISIDAVKSLLKRARHAFREAYASIEHERGVPILLFGSLSTLWPRACARCGRARDRLVEAFELARHPPFVFQSVAETLSTAGLAGILMLSSAIGNPAEARAPQPIVEAIGHEKEVRPNSAATPARSRYAALIQHRIYRSSTAADVSVSGSIDRGRREERRLRIEITRDVPGQPETGRTVFVDVPCDYFGPEEAACDVADQLAPDD